VNHSLLSRLLVGIGVVTGNVIAAQPPADATVRTRLLRSFAFYAENDLFVADGSNEDRNYTGGFGFLFAGDFVSQWKLDLPLRTLDRWTGLDIGPGKTFDEPYPSLLFFGTGFTPDNLNTRQPVRNDRPYASLVGLTVSTLWLNSETKDEAWTTDFTAGLLGLSVARNLQTKIHREARRGDDIIPYDPLGWHNQISDGGEPTFLYRATYERRLAGGAVGPQRKHWQLSGGYQLSAGYYTNAAALANVRVGAFNSDLWEFTPGALSVGNQVATKTTPSGTPWQWFLFGGARGRAVAYNALLEGQFRDSEHTVRPKRLLLEWDLGLSVFVPRLLGSSLNTQIVWNANSGRTAEFDGSSRSHRWGSFYVVFSSDR
jgi:hypothetical protein